MLFQSYPMPLKLFLIFLLFFASQPNTLFAQKADNAQKKFESDVKTHCTCLADLDKQIQREKKKAKRLRKKRSGQRPLGGDSVNFSLEDCLENRRAVKTRNRLLNMSKQEQEEYRNRVLQAVKKQCPRLYSRVLN